MKDLIIRELFWFVISFLIALVGSFLFLELLALSSAEPELNSLEKLFTLQLYIIGCIVSLFRFTSSGSSFRSLKKRFKNSL